MKILFISDIHGSFYYAKEAVNKFKEEGADYLVILGDELNHGPRNPLPKEYNPQETANLLNQYKDKIIAIRGNCDSEVDQMLLKYPIMSDFSIILHNGRRLFLTHGHIYNPDNLPPLSKGDVFFFGHIHVPIAEMQNDIYIINPGSISLPFNNYPNSYGILENNTLKIKDFSGNVIKEVSFE